VLIQEQYCRAGDRSHHQRQRLALPARQSAHERVQTLLQTDAGKLEEFADLQSALVTNCAAKATAFSPLERHRDVLFDRHAGCRSCSGILVDAANEGGAAVQRQSGDVFAVEPHATPIGRD
jgi:hypothetical protein